MKPEKPNPGPRVKDQPKKWALVNTLGGPTFFLLMLALPIPSIGFPIRAALGLMVWMAWWWISTPVHLAITGFLPLVTASLFNYVPTSLVLPSYAGELIILLIGSSMLTTVWTRWGLDRRVALLPLLLVGTSASRQIVVWFAVSAALTALLPNTVVAATMIPIVVAMLRAIGISDLWNNRFATALVLAVAWGSSAGAFTTPLGRAMNLITVQFVQDTVTRQEFLFTTWFTRLLPLAVAVIAVSLLFMRFVFASGDGDITGEADSPKAAAEASRQLFRDQWRALGPMSVPEKWALFLFISAALLAFTRQLYASVLPSFTPAFGFLTFGILCFVIRHDGEPLVRWEYAQGKMMWGLFYLFAGGSALGAVVSQTGTARYIADQLIPYAEGGGFIAVMVFSAMTMLLTQTTSAVASVSITVPVTISTFQGLDMNPIPFVYIVTAAANMGFMLPSSAAGTAVAAGYGVNLKTMLAAGFCLAVLVLGVLVLVGYALAMFWPGFGLA